MSTTAEPARPAARPRPPESVCTVSAARVWWRAYLHHLRLLRNVAIAWIVVLAAVGAGVIAALQDEYTPEELAQIGRTLGSAPALEALFGRGVALDTLEGFALWRWGGFAVLLAAVWGMTAASRLFRRAEESGHHEPLRAGVITPRSLLAAAVAALLTTHLALAVAVGLTHAAVGLETATAWALGGTLALLAAAFAALGALAAQIAATPRLATGIVAMVLGITVGLRILAASTAAPDWLWWTTPFGWAGYLHESDQARGTVFTAYAVLLVALLAPAFALARRELHAGLIGSREAVVEHARPVRSQAVLAARLTLGPVLGWGAAVAAAGLVFGLIAADMSAAVVELGRPVLEVFDRIGYEGIDTPGGIVALLMGFVVLGLAVFAAAQAAGIREEEASWRIEHILARPVGRVRWLTTRTVVAAAAVAVLALVGAVAAWLGTAVTGTAIGFGDAILTGVNLMPVSWLFLGLGILVLGALPRLTGPLTYAAVVVAYLINLIGSLLELPEAVLDASPFRHLAAVPAVHIDVPPAIIMVAAAIAASALGVALFRRRDLREA